ncbi:MAG: hypothetical protein AAF620_15125 [Bacteroidota bacterium]
MRCRKGAKTTTAKNDNKSTRKKKERDGLLRAHRSGQGRDSVITRRSENKIAQGKLPAEKKRPRSSTQVSPK